MISLRPIIILCNSRPKSHKRYILLLDTNSPFYPKCYLNGLRVTETCQNFSQVLSNVRHAIPSHGEVSVVHTPLCKPFANALAARMAHT